MTNRSGIEIDSCQDFCGVWLDRGELDKIIERSSRNVKNIETDSYSEHQKSSQDNDYRSKKRKDYWVICLISKLQKKLQASADMPRMTRTTGYNSGLAKVVIHYSANSLVVNQTLVLRMNSNSYRNGENRQLLVLAKR